MKYPAYPITDPRDAFIAIGDRKVELPRTQWAVVQHRRSIECSYSLDTTGKSVVIRLMTEAHCSSPVEIHYDVNNWLKRWTTEELKANPDLPTSMVWSSGGINDGYTACEVAAVMNSLWCVAADMTHTLRRETCISLGIDIHEH